MFDTLKYFKDKKTSPPHTAPSTDQTVIISDLFSPEVN